MNTGVGSGLGNAGATRQSNTRAGMRKGPTNGSKAEIFQINSDLPIDSDDEN